MKNVVTKVHDGQKFVATKEYMSRQRSGRLPKRTVEECCDILCEEGIKSMSRHLIALLQQKTKQMEQNIVVTSKIILRQRMQGSIGKNVAT